MTREDIIRMAREVGGADISINGWTSWVGTQSTEYLERFAALVSSAEREQLTDAAMKAAEKAVDVAIALEREACAKVCDEYAQNSSNPMNFAENCAKSIRARGKA